jgi:hypothetical protein
MALILADSDDLEKQVLPAVASGEAMASYALSERESGSDAAAMRTRVRQTATGGSSTAPRTIALVDVNGGLRLRYGLDVEMGRSLSFGFGVECVESVHERGHGAERPEVAQRPLEPADRS